VVLLLTSRGKGDRECRPIVEGVGIQDRFEDYGRLEVSTELRRTKLCGDIVIRWSENARGKGCRGSNHQRLSLLLRFIASGAIGVCFMEELVSDCVL
jgi:hypothetical protein